MIELCVVTGRVSDEQLHWIKALYGPVDEKYGSLSFLRHQYLDNPLGWSVHVFCLDDGSPIAHTSAIPCLARMGNSEILAAKVEGLVVLPDYRGRRSNGTSIAVAINERLHEATHAQGVAVLFALATEQANRVFERAGFHAISHVASSFVLVTSSVAAGRSHQLPAIVGMKILSAIQRLGLAFAFACSRRLAGGPSATLRNVSLEDVAIVETPRTDRWTICAADAWSWYGASGLLYTLEISGPRGSSAVIRLPSMPGDRAPAQIIAWQPRHGGTLSAVLLLGFAAELARTRGAATLRFQPWGTQGAETLSRACRLLGFVRRSIVVLELHGDQLFDDVSLSPFFYVTY